MLQYLSLFYQLLSCVPLVPPPPHGGLKGQMVTSHPPPHAQCDHHRVGIKWDRVSYGVQSSDNSWWCCPSTAIFPLPTGKTIFYYCISLYLAAFMQLGRSPPLGVQGAARSISSDVPVVIWHMRESFTEIFWRIIYFVLNPISYRPQMVSSHIMSATIFYPVES